MKLLIYDHDCFGTSDVCEALTNMSHTYRLVYDDDFHLRVSAEFDSRFEDIISEGFDCVFSFNYSPIVSNNCKRHNIPYIAFVYDSPLVALYSYTIINPCNYVFMFDKAEYLKLKNCGINTVYYAPLAANVNRITSLVEQIGHEDNTYSNDISFVGSMYNEKHNLFDRLKNLPPYVSGYLDAIMKSQLKVYGYNFIEELLTPDIITELQKSVPLAPNKDGVETIEYLYSNYFLARKMAYLERTGLLKDLSDLFKVSLYTPNPVPELTNAIFKGSADYYNEMPLIFNQSKINLNITLRSIQSGIPLRCIDIMASGGFCLSNYQADFYDAFVPGEDCILYESAQDCIDKCRYYLSHDAERIQIAQNGLGRVRDNHTFEIRLSQIFDIVFN